MVTSILTSIKKLLGVSEEDVNFDTDIIMHINSAFFKLNQLGVGPSTCFIISDKTAKWETFLQNRQDLESAKIFVYLNVRLIFDPPQSSFLLDSIKEQIREIEWRLNIQVEGGS